MHQIFIYLFFNLFLVVIFIFFFNINLDYKNISVSNDQTVFITIILFNIIISSAIFNKINLNINKKICIKDNLFKKYFNYLSIICLAVGLYGFLNDYNNYRYSGFKFDFFNLIFRIFANIYYFLIFFYIFTELKFNKIQTFIILILPVIYISGLRSAMTVLLIYLSIALKYHHNIFNIFYKFICGKLIKKFELKKIIGFIFLFFFLLIFLFQFGIIKKSGSLIDIDNYLSLHYIINRFSDHYISIKFALIEAGKYNDLLNVLKERYHKIIHYDHLYINYTLEHFNVNKININPSPNEGTSPGFIAANLYIFGAGLKFIIVLNILIFIICQSYKILLKNFKCNNFIDHILLYNLFYSSILSSPFSFIYLFDETFIIILFFFLLHFFKIKYK